MSRGRWETAAKGTPKFGVHKHRPACVWPTNIKFQPDNPLNPINRSNPTVPFKPLDGVSGLER
jgi:hypothetical protein